MNAFDIATPGRAVVPYERSGFRISVFGDFLDIDSLFGAPSQCVQLTSGRFRAELAAFQIGSVSISELSANCGMHVRVPERPNTLLVGLIDKGEALWEHGRLWSSGELLVCWGAPLSLSALAPIDIVWMQIDLQALTGLEKRKLGPHVEGSSYIAPAEAGALEDFWGYLRALMREHLAHSASSFSQESFRTSESRLITLAGRVLASMSPKHFDTKTTRARFALVERVVQYMWDNVEEPLALERICTDMHCRMRSLIYSFKNTVGIGPMTYLKILRLNAARKRLKSVGSNKRIFDVAADFGFWHMGHFSSDYKRLFGTTASETVAAAEAEGSPA